MAGIPWVLIVDDEAEVRQTLGELIRAAGFRVSTARDGEEGLVLFTQIRPSVVLTDLRMPRLDGPTMIERLRSNPANESVPIIVLTGDQRRDVKIRLLQLGADEFVYKPVDASELVARLDALARRSRMMRLVGGPLPQLDQRSTDPGDRDLERLAWRLVAAVERSSGLSDDDTAHHIQRVAALAALLVRAAGEPPDVVAEVRRFAGLHDIGKIGLPDHLLHKTGILSPSEHEQVRTHTVIGADLLRSAGMPRVAVDIALHHHERWDGQGYPHGLAGARTPLVARAMAVVDALDGMTTRRPYREPVPFEVALGDLLSLRGTQLDGELVDLVVDNAAEVERIRAQHAARAGRSGEWA